MSEVANQTAGPNILDTDYNTAKMVIHGGRYETATYTNGTGSEVTLPKGTLLGRISASNKVQPLASAAVDGSQFPVGILNESITVADGASYDLSMVIAGEVDASFLSLDGSDTLATVVSGRTIGDRIKSDTLGILLVDADELSEYE